MAKLLVSVRSSAEALAALAGGADIIDLKEPSHGSLGRASLAAWREVRQIVPAAVPISVALGELTEWAGDTGPHIPPDAWKGLAYAKLGLANAPAEWADHWRSLDHRLGRSASYVPAWVAVVYIDWQAAHAPEPDTVIEMVSTLESCQGVLFDTWDKSTRLSIDIKWRPQIERVRDSGRFVALAGSLDAAAIRRLVSLAPDIFAVRGAACINGDRLAAIDPERVKELAAAVDSG